jgi:hypothetical protein
MFGRTHVGILQVAVYKDIFCNKCGRSCQTTEGYPQFAELTSQWGYASSKDGERHQAHLCEACYDQVVSNFAIPLRVVETAEMPNPMSEEEFRGKEHEHDCFIVWKGVDE